MSPFDNRSRSFGDVLCFLRCVSQGMMIDEADEFVAGPQNKKRGHSSDPNSSTTVKRRRSMSPLLRRPQTPPGSANHVLVGKSPVGVQGQQNLLKPIPQHKGQTGRMVLCGSLDVCEM